MKDGEREAREENAKYQTRCSRSDRAPRLEGDGERVEPGLQEIAADRGEIEADRGESEADRGESEARQSAQSTAARGGYQLHRSLMQTHIFPE